MLQHGYGKSRVIKDVQRCLLKGQDWYLLRLLHNQTTSTLIHLRFLLKLYSLGLFRSSPLVMGLEQAIILSSEIVDFFIYWKEVTK